MENKKPPKTLAQRVRDAEEKALAAGAIRVRCILHPEAAQALEALMTSGYASSKTAAIARALQDAAKNNAEK